MRVTKVPESGPKRSLLDATERLVVEKGFDLVSVRDITGAIKANVAAVNYHFGSREALMDVVMSHVMDVVDAARIEALEDIARLESRGPVEKIVRAYVNSVLIAAGRAQMDLAFFLKLAGRVMVFPSGLISPALADGRKEVGRLYLKALASAVPDMGAGDLEAAWAFFEVGLGQSLINLRSDLEPVVQAEQWIQFGVRGLAGGGVSQKTDRTDQSNPTDLPGKTVAPEIAVAKADVPKATPAPEVVPTSEVAVAPEVVETPKPAKASKAKPKKQDDQTMLFEL
ncbi:MAG: TetR/AcrR family transcriptional regulator [Akkermansiaceae bacterium]|nr:TetR/AcrR family transcriptional regulator [Luteolibacter sp.]